MAIGSKILIVEDHYLLAEDICEFIADSSMQAIGPANCVETALVYAREAELDAAILDVDLGGKLCFPICAILASRNIPFIFHTGFNDLSLLPSEFQSAQKISKPFDHDELRKALDNMLSGVGHIVATSVASGERHKDIAASS